MPLTEILGSVRTQVIYREPCRMGIGPCFVQPAFFLTGLVDVIKTDHPIPARFSIGMKCATDGPLVGHSNAPGSVLCLHSFSFTVHIPFFLSRSSATMSFSLFLKGLKHADMPHTTPCVFLELSSSREVCASSVTL